MSLQTARSHWRAPIGVVTGVTIDSNEVSLMILL